MFYEICNEPNGEEISWINWSFSNIDEATSIIKKGATEIKDENLTESGKFIKSVLIKK